MVMCSFNGTYLAGPGSTTPPQASSREGVSKLVQPQHAAACRSVPQHAAACRSTFFLELHMGVLKHAAACRSVPQHAAACRSEPKFSHGGLFLS